MITNIFDCIFSIRSLIFSLHPHRFAVHQEPQSLLDFMHTTLKLTTTLGMADVTQATGLKIMSRFLFLLGSSKPDMKLSSLGST